LKSRIESKGLGTGSAGFMRLYTDRFGIIKLPVPPKKEQSNIVQGINAATEKIDTAVDRARREAILRMKEQAPGADAIVNLRLETTSISKGSRSRNQSVSTVEALAYIGSSDLLEIAISGGNAAKTLNLTPGDEIIFKLKG